jgi:hypothetical protein
VTSNAAEATCIVRRIERDAADDWDAFVARSNDGTLFHEVAFLRYHGDRFAQAEHLLAIERKRRQVAVWPLALLMRDGRLSALSPYGASYGGPALAEAVGMLGAREILAATIDYVRAQGAREFRVTLPPRACSGIHSDTFRLAMHEAGFQCTNRDITSVIAVDERLPESRQLAMRRAEWERRARRAQREGVRIVDNAPLADFWTTLEATVRKHGQTPTHTRDELDWLARELPRRVYFACAYLDDKPVAGVCYFAHNARVLGTFYLCQDPEHQATQAMSALLLEGLRQAKEDGFAWIDLGTSSVGMKAHDSIFRFKETLGSIGQFRETYVLEFAR